MVLIIDGKGIVLTAVQTVHICRPTHFICIIYKRASIHMAMKAGI